MPYLLEARSPSRDFWLGVFCVALLLSASTRLLFLGGGFLVGFEEGLLDVCGDELVAAVLWRPSSTRLLRPANLMSEGRWEAVRFRTRRGEAGPR